MQCARALIASLRNTRPGQTTRIGSGIFSIVRTCTLDVCVRSRNYAKAYQYLKQCVFEYPETEWARRARGLLLQEEKAFREFQ